MHTTHRSPLQPNLPRASRVETNGLYLDLCLILASRRVRTGQNNQLDGMFLDAGYTSACSPGCEESTAISAPWWQDSEQFGRGCTDESAARSPGKNSCAATRSWN